jgi:hypothetical protein
MSKSYFLLPSKSEIAVTLALLAPLTEPPKVRIPVFIPLDFSIYF